MNIKKFFISLFIIIVSSFVFFTTINGDPGLIKALFESLIFSETFDEGCRPLSLKNFEMLNDKEKKAYINVYRKIKEHPEYIRIPDLTNKEFNNVFFAVKNDNPDILCFSDACNMVSFLNSSFLQMEYIHEVSVCNNMMNELNTFADTIISGISYEKDFDKELYIHDYIISNCEYSESKNSSNAYGCLIEKKAICSGYSRAAMILLNKAGIETMVISGTGINADNEKISHMWNVVWLNNEPYHLDVTWDDPLSETDDFISHLFFNLTDKQISADHVDLSFNVQSVDSNYNYFENQGLLFYSFDNNATDIIAEKLCENIKNGKNYIEIKFYNEKSYLSAIDGIINSKSTDDELYIIISKIRNDVENLVDISHVSFTKDDSRYYIRIMFDKI